MLVLFSSNHSSITLKQIILMENHDISQILKHPASTSFPSSISNACRHLRFKIDFATNMWLLLAIHTPIRSLMKLVYEH